MNKKMMARRKGTGQVGQERPLSASARHLEAERIAPEPTLHRFAHPIETAHGAVPEGALDEFRRVLAAQSRTLAAMQVELGDILALLQSTQTAEKAEKSATGAAPADTEAEKHEEK